MPDIVFTKWHRVNSVVGQFGSGQLGTQMIWHRTIWHQDSINGQFSTKGKQTIWHQDRKIDIWRQHNETDNLTPRKKLRPNYSLTI